MAPRIFRVAFSFVIAASACATITIAGCGAPDDSVGALSGAAPVDPHDEEAPGTPPPNDDPTIGAVPEADAGEGEPEPPIVDAGKDASPPKPPAKVASPVPGKVVTYPYGVKNSNYAAGYHTGDDYATPTGSNALAVRSGTVRWSNDNGGAYGKWMGLDADNGRTYVYCHLSSRLLSAGAKVVAGQVLAKTGATGNVTGPHLHFEDHPLGPFVYGSNRKPTW